MRRGGLNPSKASVVQAVGRRMVPYLVEATVIPTALFYTFFVAFGCGGRSSPRWAGPTPPWDGGSSPDGRFPAC